MTLSVNQAKEIVKILKSNNNNLSKTARDLKISRNKVYFAIELASEAKLMESWIKCAQK
ncbi:hypothetical protein [Helicobacter sp. MIT 05-5294]|uniref:hypothetical protein n=1 Tax=Helicobacter sp. MIT 05-5294 TaxID=1548150 RepID=UPI00188348F3|nr:hypothetical protein [Helicobacter sp. MIT 05-5294]